MSVQATAQDDLPLRTASPAPRQFSRRLPAVEQRQRTILVLAGAPGDLAGKPALTEVSAGNAVRELLQVFVDLLGAPAAAKVMADDHVKLVTAVGAAAHLRARSARCGRRRGQARRC